MDEERRDGEGAPLYLRQGGAGLLTEVTTRWEGWGGMSGGQHRCGWLFLGGGGGGWVFFFLFLFRGWNEERKVGERHGGVHGTDTDNTEKPGRTVNYTS